MPDDDLIAQSRQLIQAARDEEGRHTRRRRTWKRATVVIDDLETWPRSHVTVPQLAAYLDTDARTIRRIIDCGKLPARRVGNEYRIKTVDARRVFSVTAESA